MACAAVLGWRGSNSLITDKKASLMVLQISFKVGEEKPFSMFNSEKNILYAG